MTKIQLKPYLSDKATQVLTTALGFEYQAYHLYRCLFAYFLQNGMKVAAQWAANEAEGEHVHAQKIEDFAANLGVYLPYKSLPLEMPTDFGKAIEIFQEAESSLLDFYEAEYGNALEGQDFLLSEFLSDFVEIQTEAVQEVNKIVRLLDGVELTKINILQIENQIFG